MFLRGLTTDCAGYAGRGEVAGRNALGGFSEALACTVPLGRTVTDLGGQLQRQCRIDAIFV